MSAQYECHYCRRREGKTFHLGYWSCYPCQREVKDHSTCPPDCYEKTRKQVEEPK